MRRALVIAIPLLLASIGGLVILAWTCFRRPPNRPRKQSTRRAVSTRAQLTRQNSWREKLVEEIMDKVGVLLSEVVQQGRGFCSSNNNEPAKDRRSQRTSVEEQDNTSGHGVIIETAETSGTTLPPRCCNPFTALSIEQLQRNLDTTTSSSQKVTEANQEILKSNSCIVKMMPEEQTVVTCSNNMQQEAAKGADEIVVAATTTTDTNNDVQDINSVEDLEVLLHSAAGRLCRSILALSSLDPASMETSFILPKLSASSSFPEPQPVRIDAATTAAGTSTDAPQVLKGGGGSSCLLHQQIEKDNDHFEFPDCKVTNTAPEIVPSTASDRSLAKDQSPLDLRGYGWSTAPEWQKEFDNEIIKNRRVHSRYYHPRKEVIPLYEAVRQYYKEEQETVRNKWLDIQKRYLATKEMLKLKRLAEEQQQQLDKGADAQVNTKGHKLSSSSSDFGDEKSKQVVRSMLTSSSDTTDDDDDDDDDKSSENAPRQTSIKGKCKRKHTK
ncbi:unnamed protein product [Sphagnum jensenii]|uniref:Uncharacterized protein n=1 Tax=Sphagnum jensenii TaxID=128206 RepID=A0ABP0XK82_9BRYO